MKKSLAKKNNSLKEKAFSQGQSTIEFLITLTFIFGLLFFYIKLAINYTNGYLLHYATFMAGRSYLVFDRNSNEESPQDVAARVFAERNVFKKIAPQISTRIKANHPGETLGSLYTGVYFDFEQFFSYSHLVGGRVPMALRSEALLGREPTRTECLRRIADAFKEIAGVEEFNLNVTFEDNGC